MQFGILTTDNGTHTPEKWAANAASRIVSISPSASQEHQIAAQRLTFQIAEILLKHHEDAHGEITNTLISNADAAFENVTHDPGQRAKNAADQVIAAAKGTAWEEAFNKPEIAGPLHQIIGQSLVDLTHVERLHFSDKNPGHVAAAAYKLKYTAPLLAKQQASA
jgi:hypothetical protein